LYAIKISYLINNGPQMILVSIFDHHYINKYKCVSYRVSILLLVNQNEKLQARKERG